MAEEHIKPQAPDEESEEYGPRRVLVVEDEALIAMYVEDVVCRFGYSVAGVVSNVDEALDFIETHSVDLAVLDINVKGKLVFPLADALMRRNIPFVFASAYGIGGIPARYRNGPVVQKPFAPSELQRALESADRVSQRKQATR